MVAGLKYRKKKPIIFPNQDEAIEILINYEEIRLMQSFYDLNKATGKKNKDEIDNLRRYYRPIG